MVISHVQGLTILCEFGTNINLHFIDLETAMAKDALKKHLSKRAEKDDLVQRASYLCQTSSGLYMGFANLAFEEY